MILTEKELEIWSKEQIRHNFHSYRTSGNKRARKAGRSNKRSYKPEREYLTCNMCLKRVIDNLAGVFHISRCRRIEN